MCVLSHVPLSVTPVARQAPLSMGLSRHRYWSGLPFPPPENLPDPGVLLGVPLLHWRLWSPSHLGKSERGSQGPPPVAEASSWTGGEPMGCPPGHSEGGVCWAGLFWSLLGLCQILASPRTSPRGLGGSPGPRFLPGEINQLSNCPDT